MAACSIPTVDFSPFLKQGDEESKQKAMEIIGKACSDYGIFQIVNHGIPLNLINRALEQSKIFFDYPDEEKLVKATPDPNAPLPAGYSKRHQHSPDKNEYIIGFHPRSTFNNWPENPSQLREVFGEIFCYLSKTALTVESIVNDCLGLPPNCLREFNHDRSWDFMTALHYSPASEFDNTGLSKHQDGNSISLIVQDQIGGLELLHDGEWIPVTPAYGAIAVILGDVMQVLSNNIFKSAMHRVLRPKEGNRYSFAFFHSVHGDTLIEPLPQLTKEIGAAPKYRGFLFKDYQELRMRNVCYPPSRPEEETNISHYAI